jgi:hypothetical protein
VPPPTTIKSNIWQFLKFQAFAEQLTKETQDLKVKIETHKRENRRLTGLIDQQKDDAARLTLRLSGTEKQRDDALEALVLQQEIAEELERERKRNKKELSAMQHATTAITRQRDEAQRVVLHLRSLINGQTHHMEHIIRSLGSAPELSEYIEEGFEDVPEDDEGVEENVEGTEVSKKGDAKVGAIKNITGLKSEARHGAVSRSSEGGIEGEDVSPEMESHFLNHSRSKRYSQLSMSDVADRHLRDKTDAIADIIRNISEQCAAAVEGLQLAQDAEEDEQAESPEKHPAQQHRGHHLTPSSDDGHLGSEASDAGDGEAYLTPDGRNSSIPPTPDLVHNRSSTSMSMNSSSTVPGERTSQQYALGDIPTKIVEDDDEPVHENRSENGSELPMEAGTLTKQPSQDLMSRPSTARIVN